MTKTESAIIYAVNRIADDPAVYWHYLGTESWSRLIDAYAEITGKDPSDLHRDLQPPAAVYEDYCEKERRRDRLDSGGDHLCVSCQARAEWDPEISEAAFRDATLACPSVLNAFERLPDYDRREILTNLATAAV